MLSKYLKSENLKYLLAVWGRDPEIIQAAPATKKYTISGKRLPIL